MKTQIKVIPVWFQQGPNFVAPVSRQSAFTRWSITILLWITVPAIPIMKWIVARANERDDKRHD